MWYKLLNSKNFQTVEVNNILLREKHILLNYKECLFIKRNRQLQLQKHLQRNW